MLPMLSELLCHTQGTYIAQKLIAAANQEEIIDVCNALLPESFRHLLHSKARCVKKYLGVCSL